MSEKVTKIVIFGTGRQAELLYFGLELSDEAFDILGVYGEETENDAVFGLPVNGPEELMGLAGMEFDILFYCMDADAPLQDMLGKAFGRARVRPWDAIGEYLTADQKERWLDRLRTASEEDPGYAFYFGEILGKTGNREKGYLYLLLADALGKGREQIAAAQKLAAVDTELLDCHLLQELLEKLLFRLTAAERYDTAFAFLGDLMFREHKFLYAKILDCWARYYYILLEIAICERNRGAAQSVMKEWADWRKFETPLRQFKFAFRRIWFGFAPEEQRMLLCLAKQYQVSADCLAVLCKGAVHETYAAAVLKKSAELFAAAGQTETASGLLHYAAVFERMHPDGKPCMICRNCQCDLAVTELDAKEGKAVCAAESRIGSGTKRVADNGAVIDAGGSAENCANRDTDSGKGHEIACIMCVNDEDYVKEMILYLKRQRLPEGYRLCLYLVRGADSMTAGYELARKNVSADMKLYMHQDTFIFDEEYLKNLVDRLQNADYAMLGLAGTVKLPKSAVWGESDPDDMRFCLYQDFTLQALEAVTPISADTSCQEVECIDGVLMAARVDVPWREDLLKGFHFYDISQCMEYRKRGYRIGFFDNGGHAGVLHEVNVSKNERYERGYEEARQTFLRNYKNY